MQCGIDTDIVESHQSRHTKPRVIPPKHPVGPLRAKKKSWKNCETELAAAERKASKLREQLVEFDKSVTDLGEQGISLKTEWTALKDQLESDTSQKRRKSLAWKS